MRWESESAGRGLTLSHELRPGGNRPGPVDLWGEFDATVGRLGIAMAAGKAGLIRRALEELSVTLHDIAEELDRYRGRRGNWEQPPPPDGSDEDDSGEPADPAAATE